MPTSREIVSNKPLTGSELQSIMRKDFEELLRTDGLLGGMVAFGRVSYEVRVIIHMDNYSYPTHQTSAHSRRLPGDQLADHPDLAALETGLPLSAPSPLSFVVDQELHRDINSPNVARIENGLPVTIQRRDADGGSTEQSVQYPPEMAEARGPVPTVTDRADATRLEWQLPTPKSCDCVGTIKTDSNGCCTGCGGTIEFAVEG